MKRSNAFLFWALPIGWIIALSPLTGDSNIWTAWCLLSAWIGTVMGWTASQGLASLVLANESSAIPPANRLRHTVIGLFAFWGPNIAAIAFGISLAGSLPEGMRPEGMRGSDGSPAWMLQCFSMYFCSTGAAWSGVWRLRKEAMIANG